MKKVLFFIESLSGGGAEKVLFDLVTNLDKNKYDITVCSLIDVGVYNEKLSNVCNYISILPNKSTLSIFGKLLYNLKYKAIRTLPSKWMYNYFFKEKYDVEIAFIEGYATKIIGSSSNLKSTKITWVHIDLYENHWTANEYKSLNEEINIYKSFDHIACVAQSVQDAFTKRFGIKDKLCVKYNPVNREDIILRSKEICDFNKTKNKIRLVTVGRLEQQKGYDRLLEVVSKLKKEGFNFELWIVGEGSQRGILENYIRLNNLEDVVTLHGFQKNPYKFINQSDAFVCSSRSEGYSTVVTEALILGKPVVATDCSGMKELLGDNVYGIITKNTIEDLYSGIKKFLENNDLQIHFTEKSLVRSKDFDIKKTIQNIEDLL